MTMKTSAQSRRAFIQRGVYVAPAILTLAAAPEFAKAGSVKPSHGGPGKDDKGGKDGKGNKGNKGKEGR